MTNGIALSRLNPLLNGSVLRSLRALGMHQSLDSLNPLLNGSVLRSGRPQQPALGGAVSQSPFERVSASVWWGPVAPSRAARLNPLLNGSVLRS